MLKTSLSISWAVGLLALIVTLKAAGEDGVTAAQADGTWKTKSGEFKVWLIGKEMLRVEFSGSYEFKSPEGLMVKTCEGHSVASIEGDTAIFKPDGAEDECRITMKFTRGKLIVAQIGTCGFGNNVTANGTYKRVSRREPKFKSGEGD